MRSPRFSANFLAAQVAGSCRLEGIPVSKQDEQTMKDIIAGNVDSAQLRRDLVKKFQSQNQATLDIAAGQAVSPCP